MCALVIDLCSIDLQTLKTAELFFGATPVLLWHVVAFLIPLYGKPGFMVPEIQTQ